MTEAPTITKPRTVTRVEKPKLYKVILLNVDFTPRAFVVRVLFPPSSLCLSQGSIPEAFPDLTSLP